MTLTREQTRLLREAEVGASGNRITKAVELAGVTLVEIAKATSLPYSYVSDVGRGRHQTITVENAHKFADFFGVHIEDLFPAREAVA
jgi:transcriptional regulator with XRE-family HTH domain